jgi:hypothetical protein
MHYFDGDGIHDPGTGPTAEKVQSGMVLAAIMALCAAIVLMAIAMGVLWYFGAFAWFQHNWPPFVASALMLGMAWSAKIRC